jgi:DTW domain-containing protein YfiP
MVQPHLVHRCIACRLRWDLCICAIRPALALPTSVVVLMHSKEWRRASNTGHLARLAVDGTRVVLHGRPEHRLTAQDLAPPGSHPILLYPGRGAAPLTPESTRALTRPVTLIVPDGNWGQASQMVKRIPGLDQIPAMALPLAPEGVVRLRRNITPDRMSTLEAIALALGVLEGPDAEERILAFYNVMVQRMLHLRGKVRHAALGL